MSKLQTRGQKDLVLAEGCVVSVSQMDAEVGRIYGGLCHSFPVLVRTCGLAQAVAFSLAKSASGNARGKAHRTLLEHVGQMIGVKPDPAAVVAAIQEAGTLEYMQQTRRVLDACIYFKRFAVSILKAESARDAEENT